MAGRVENLPICERPCPWRGRVVAEGPGQDGGLRLTALPRDGGGDAPMFRRRHGKRLVD